MNNEPELRTLAGGSVLILIGMLLSFSLEFAIRVIAARILDEAGFGLLFLGLKLLNFFLLVSLLGLDNGTVTKLASSLGQGDKDAARAFSGSAFMLSFCLASLGSLAMWGFSDFLAMSFQVAGLSAILKILSIAVLPIIMVRTITATLRGMKRFAPKVAFDDGFFFGLRLVLIVVAAFLVVSASTLALAISAAAVISAAIYLIYFAKTNPLGMRVSSQHAKSLVAFSLPLGLQIVAYHLMTSSDVLALGIHTSASTVGLYGTIVILSQFVPIGMMAVYFAFLPAAAELYATGHVEALRRSYSVASRWGVFMSLPVFVLLEAFPRTCLSIFGPEYMAAASWMQILALGYLVHAVIGMSGPTVVAIGAPRVTGIAWTVAAVLSFAMAILTVPYLGAFGAAASIVVGFTIVNAIHLHYLKRRVEIKYMDGRTLRALVVSAIVILCFRVVLPEPTEAFPILWLIPLAALIGVLIVVGIAVFGG